MKLWTADGNFIRDLNPIESKTTLNSANAAVFTPSKESIIIGRSDGRLWMVPILENDSSNKTLTDFAAHDGSISKLSFVDDGKTLVSFCEDGTIRFWDYSSFLVTGKLSLKVTLKSNFSYLRFGEVINEQFILTADKYGNVFLWDGRRKKELRLSD